MRWALSIIISFFMVKLVWREGNDTPPVESSTIPCVAKEDARRASVVVAAAAHNAAFIMLEVRSMVCSMDSSLGMACETLRMRSISAAVS